MRNLQCRNRHRIFRCACLPARHTRRNIPDPRMSTGPSIEHQFLVGRRLGGMKTSVSIACALLLACAPAAFAQSDKHLERDNMMSANGKRAAAVAAKIVRESANAGARRAAAVAEEEGDAEEAPGGQAEVSIAVDASGQHIVIGYNDTRGFSENPISLSGVLYSADGGRTFVDGGRLPTPGTDVIGTTRFPQVFGDPEVKYLGGCTFVYSSIMLAKFSATTAVQTMSLHRSTDCGKTWQGPFEVTAATNPNHI